MPELVQPTEGVNRRVCRSCGARTVVSLINNTKNHRRKLVKSGWHTYDGWPHQGRHVRKGEKSTRRDKDGRPIFHISQTDVSGAAIRRPNPDNPLNDPWHGFDVDKQDIDDHFFSDGYMDSIGDR